MKMNRPSRSRAFLVEFIIVILFFAIASAIIVRVFAVAHSLREKANDLTVATAKVQSVAEYAKVSESQEGYIRDLKKLGAVKEDKDKERYVFYYNKDWQQQPANLEHTYSIVVVCDTKALGAGELLQVLINASKVNRHQMNKENHKSLSEIYDLQAAKYYPKSNH
ncbi:type II secretion system protein [Cellulosilyticum sp. I15G10I2]|uniref:type II secretion system protein n=1 Tax=Cellulosilyticum sp. I15G10I2 TaxID=1892843 RepID=UPI00085C5577|nr:hypothetical protein [Cellulosilyticum sp. I15G10I2]